MGTVNPALYYYEVKRNQEGLRDQKRYPWTVLEFCDPSEGAITIGWFVTKVDAEAFCQLQEAQRLWALEPAGEYELSPDVTRFGVDRDD